MNSKLQWGTFLFIFFLLGGTPNYTLQSKSGAANWELCTVCGIPARVALNDSPGPTMVPRRHIYLSIGESDFTEEKLRKMFEGLSSAFPDPIFLTVTAFSNKGFLEQLIAAVEQDSIVDFADTPEGREAQRKYISVLYPPRQGYFQAYYLRPAVNQESFQYTPTRENEKTVLVVLRSSGKGS